MSDKKTTSALAPVSAAKAKEKKNKKSKSSSPKKAISEETDNLEEEGEEEETTSKDPRTTVYSRASSVKSGALSSPRISQRVPLKEVLQRRVRHQLQAVEAPHCLLMAPDNSTHSERFFH